MDNLTCTKCGQERPITEFQRLKPQAGRKERLFRTCRTCKQAYNREYSEKNKQSTCERGKARRIELRLRTLRHYSGGVPRCACCGEDRYEFLAIDHIDGSGRKHRRENCGSRSGAHDLYQLLHKQGYPPGMRVLCHNCNSSYGYYGYCPHNEPVRDETHWTKLPPEKRPRKQRENWLKGEEHVATKITERDVVWIRHVGKGDAGFSVRIAKALGICPSAVSAIRSGTSWSWLEQPSILPEQPEWVAIASVRPQPQPSKKTGFTERDVIWIRHLGAGKRGIGAKMARALGVSTATISGVLSGRSWGWFPQPEGLPDPPEWAIRVSV